MPYDYIVVGAGSAGATIAARLTEDPNVSVLLIEAGPDFPTLEDMPEDVKYGYGHGITARENLAATHRWHFVAKATDYGPPMIVPRGKTTGGSSAVNAQIFLRGVPEDYDDWASWGNDEWSFEKLLPYFRKIETDTDYSDDFHGSDGPIIVRRYPDSEMTDDQNAWYEACRDYGFADSPDHNDPDSTGVGPCPFNNPNRIRWSTNIAYLGPARERPNLTILADALTHRVVFDGRRALGVEVEVDGKTRTEFGRETILSAGAIGSPHILMLSGVGPAGHLAEYSIPIVCDAPGVGKNLRDHPQAPVLWRTAPEFTHPEGTHGIQFVLRYTATGSNLRNDMLVHPISRASESRIYTDWDKEPVGVGMIAAIYLAESAGEMWIRDADPRVQPYLDYNLLSTRFDLDRLRESIHICIEIAKREPLASMVVELLDPTPADLESDDALDEWLLRNVRTSHHISGTCKMGAESDALSVVDQRARVRGVEGLRVADASIMPDCIRANTNATSILIGERVADFIKEDRG